MENLVKQWQQIPVFIIVDCPYAVFELRTEVEGWLFCRNMTQIVQYDSTQNIRKNCVMGN